MFSPVQQAAIDRLWSRKPEQADDILSHGLAEDVRHVRAQPGVESVTLCVGKGLEIPRFTKGK